jgi:hypothetical protein
LGGHRAGAKQLNGQGDHRPSNASIQHLFPHVRGRQPITAMLDRSPRRPRAAALSWLTDRFTPDNR